MKPRLFRGDSTEFSSLGIGVLAQTISCVVTEQLGVAPTLEMSLINSDPLFADVTVGNIIACIPNKNTPSQAFIIEEITKPIDGIVTIYATHIAQHRAKLIPVAPFTASNLDEALTKMVSESMEDNPFTLVRDPGKNNVTATMHPTVPHSFRELIGGVAGSVLDTYRGEWGYDNFTITLYNKRGRDNGARVMYGRNMSDFNLEEQFNWNSSATGVIGYWVSQEDGTTVIGDIQYSENADLYPYNKTVCMDFSEKFETAPSKTDLNTYALTWINGKGLIGASVDVAYQQVNVEGGADVGIGDVVHIYNGTYNFEMESRIVGLEFDVLSEEYTNVSIGDMKTTLNEAISDIGGGSSSYSSGGGGGGGGSSVKYFLNQTVSSWTSDSTYPLYPYKGFISITGVSSADGGEVSYSTADADSGNYSPICQTTTNGVYIWAKTQPQSLTIPTIAIAVNSDIDLHGEAPYLSTEHGGSVDGDVTFNDIVFSKRDGASFVSDQQAIDTQTAPSSTLWKNIVLIRDKNESEVGNIMAVQYTDKTSGVHFESAKMVNGVRKSHAMRILLDANGNDVVQLSQAAWLTALGLNVTDNLQCTGASNITFSLNKAERTANTGFLAIQFKSSTALNGYASTGITVPTALKPSISRNVYVACDINGVKIANWQVLDTGVIRCGTAIPANVLVSVSIIYPVK